jgi:hypothetical protein
MRVVVRPITKVVIVEPPKTRYLTIFIEKLKLSLVESRALVYG